MSSGYEYSLRRVHTASLERASRRGCNHISQYSVAPVLTAVCRTRCLVIRRRSSQVTASLNEKEIGLSRHQAAAVTQRAKNQVRRHDACARAILPLRKKHGRRQREIPWGPRTLSVHGCFFIIDRMGYSVKKLARH